MPLINVACQRWYAFQQLGISGVHAPWQASPIFIERVLPLKTGAGLLELDLVIALRPFAPRTMHARLAVQLRTRDALIARWQAPGEPECLVAITDIDYGWIEQHCQWIADTRHVLSLVESDDGVIQFSNAGDGGSIQAYLSTVFGSTADDIIVGAAAAKRDWQGSSTPAKRMGTTDMQLSCRGMPAYLLLKGTIPQQQEEKWFIFREGDRVVFQRSWTGIRIWEATIAVTEEAVTVTALTVNLDRSQYGYGSPETEIARFSRCVQTVLWRREAWSYEPEAEPARMAAAAWRRLPAG